MILKKCSTPSAYETRTHKKFCQSNGPSWIRISNLLENFVNKKSDAKVRASVFVGPDIRDLMKDEKFDHDMDSLELHGCLEIVQASDTQFSR